MMIGTIINAVTVILSSLLGMVIGSHLNERIRNAIINVLGLAVLLIGIKMALETKNVLIPTLSIVVGTAMGELIGIEKALESFGDRVERRLGKGRFSEGFVTATLLYCVGPMAILGPIQEGLTGDYSILMAKSLLDGVAAIALASALGIGVAFSSISILVYQGFFAFLASQVGGIVNEEIIAEFTATGGLLIMGIGINLLELKKLRVGNMLPALVVSPATVVFLQLMS